MTRCFKWMMVAVSFMLCLTARPQKIFFEQLTTAEGLPSDYVNCIFEDSKGFLWIGTDKGACRYDGRTFQYFSDDNGLPSNFVICFAEDPSGKIWMGTVNGGVGIYDGKNVKSFPLPGYQNVNINEIQFNTDRSFFIVSEHIGLSYFPDETTSPESFQKYSFIKKIEDNLFLAWDSLQFYLIEKNGKQLVFHPHPGLPEKSKYLPWLNDNSLVTINNNSLRSYGIHNRKWVMKNEFVIRDSTPFPSWEEIRKILFTDNGLFITSTNGLIVADNAGRQYRYTAENGLGSNYIKSVYKNKQGTIYLGTYGAGIKIWPAGYLAEFKTNGKVTSVFPADGEVYITTTKSVYQYNIPEKKMVELIFPMTDNYTGIYKEKKGSFYLGTLNNFYKFPAKLINKNSSPVNLTNYIHTARSGTSGFASYGMNTLISTYGEGIHIFDTSVRPIDSLNPASTPPAPSIVESLVPLGNSVAALTYNSGLTIYDPVNRSINLTRQQGLLSNTVYSVYKENETATWIGTKNGLNLFDGKKISKTYTNNEGLVGKNVLSIFKDRNDRLWILSDKYLHLVDGERLRAIRSHPLLFDEKNSFNRAAWSKENNLFFIGLTDALLTVDMDKVIPDTVVNIPHLSSVLKDTTVLLVRKNELLTLSNPVTKISFRFAGSYQSAFRRHDLYCKLIGFDDNWKLLSGTDEMFYQGLPSGKYELLAKTINPDGFASPEISLLSFEVLPPIWKRTWFLAIMSVLLLSAFFYVGNFLSGRRYKQKLQHLQEEYRLQLERERIARELHDNVGSQLTYLINKIDDDHSKLAEKQEAEKLSGFARGAMQELRETIWALDKKEVQWDDLGNKIRQLCRIYKKEKHMVELDWQMNGPNKQALNPLEALSIYRIIQEALNNAEKYSGATLVKVLVGQKNGSVFVEISDNGKGFDIEHTEKGYGLNNMKKRAEELNAVFTINSQPGSGTTVSLQLS